MRLEPGTYLGATVRRKARAGLCLTLSRYAPGLTQPWHVHANPTLYVLLAGTACDRSRQADFEQPRLTAVFHPTKEAHAGLVGPEGMLGLNIEYEPSWLDRHELAERDLGGYRPLDEVWSRLAVLRLLALAFAPGPQADADAETRALELLEPLVKRALGRERLACPAWLTRAREFLHDAFRSPIRVRTVAREVGVHPVHLARVFRRHHGCAVSEYLRALRLAEAGRLILRQGHTIAEAAHETGFADQAHLCRCFSSELGVSPKCFRAAARMLSG
jgi:AraC family transcriptional regulator